MQNKEIQQNNTHFCATVWVARLPSPPPRLGAEEGEGKTIKKRTRKTYSLVPQFSGLVTQTMAQHSAGGVDRTKKTQEPPRTQPNQAKNTSNPDLKTQTTPETTQGEKSRKTENCRARRRRESQLAVAAPVD